LRSGGIGLRVAERTGKGGAALLALEECVGFCGRSGRDGEAGVPAVVTPAPVSGCVDSGPGSGAGERAFSTRWPSRDAGGGASMADDLAGCLARLSAA